MAPFTVGEIGWRQIVKILCVMEIVKYARSVGTMIGLGRRKFFRRAEKSRIHQVGGASGISQIFRIYVSATGLANRLQTRHGARPQQSEQFCNHDPCDTPIHTPLVKNIFFSKVRTHTKQQRELGEY